MAKDPIQPPVNRPVSPLTQPQVKQFLSVREIAQNIGNMDPRDALEALRAKRELREMLEVELAEEEQARRKESQLRMIQSDIEDLAAAQDACTHLKENNRPAIVGQRDHQNHTSFLCLWCGKTWQDFGNDERDDARLPPHLHIPTSRIGGIG